VDCDGRTRLQEGVEFDIQEEVHMLLKWAAIFFVIAIIAAAFGFGGIAEGATDIAKILFYIFLAIFFVVLVAGLIVGGKVKSMLGR
jgi:uncharacterized membrane protein YtjA (UPF0391 family)